MNVYSKTYVFHTEFYSRIVSGYDTRTNMWIRLIFNCYSGTVKAAINYNIGNKHGFSCINICLATREVLKTEAGGRSFQHLPRDLANVNALKNHVRSLSLHKN